MKTSLVLGLLASLALYAFAVIPTPARPASLALTPAPATDSLLEPVYRRGGGGFRGGAVAHRSRTTRRAARTGRVRRSTATRRTARTRNVRRTNVVRRGRWVRPAHYRWRPGAAIAAGVAIGWVSAATAAAWAGPPPGPGLCWYYTDSTRTNGFWDVCP